MALPIPDKYKTAYVCATVGYGAVRKVLGLHDAKIQTCVRDEDSGLLETKSIPLLTPTKVLITGVCGIASVYYWPFWLYRDLCKADAWARGIPYEHYSIIDKPTSTLFYLLD
jgi:hypothetical protein